jgi:hypothetical protein
VNNDDDVPEHWGPKRDLENRVLRRIFGPKRGAIIGGWRKLHNKELHNLHA